ncbi:hypothetical protein Lokhon_01824 [Limimaricola hongkongensis DSM 17492]|uniref:Uncharacterized protein n=1 Tax=Limimaricola hongkongensis DSM 17492 TaxID=1122180 RepID=A0A017HD80_9RHOB|nr:hypothetical protein Lokhon_01824 [Limimaricola hongkongensis DSM 17492]
MESGPRGVVDRHGLLPVGRRVMAAFAGLLRALPRRLRDKTRMSICAATSRRQCNNRA